MAVPSYTHDLTDWIADADTAAWGELLNATAGGAPDEADTESALQGANSCSQITNATTLCSLCRILGASVSLTAGNVFLMWHGHGVATAMDTYANGGLRIAVATDLNNYKAWSIGGKDTAPFPYAKWVNNPLDPTVAADYTTGTPPTGGAAIFGVGSMVLLTAAVARGQPHIVDMIRYGRAEARFNGGEAANYAKFSGFAALNDAQNARWGLISESTGGYLWKGLLTLGYTSLVDFRDSNQTIFVQDCRKVSAGFNKIEIRQATSRVDWTGISFVTLSPATNASKGALQVVDDADVNLDNCAFTDMDTFVFLANSTVLNTVFRRCGQVTTGGGTFTDCTFDNSTAAVAVLAATPANAALVAGCAFVSDGTGHGLEITGAAANMTLTGNTWTGYAGSDGSTGNEAVYVNITSGSMNLTISGGTVPSVRTAGATVTVVAGAVSATVNVKTLAGANLQNARVLLKAATGGPFPFDAAVTIVNAGTTATVTHTAHGMATNDNVVIKGASLQANNGVYPITFINANSYSYTMGSTPGSSPTGTIKATFVVLSGLTDASGNITMSRVFSSDQPVSGWVRFGGSPFYKPAALGGSVDSATGYSTNALMVDDV